MQILFIYRNANYGKPGTRVMGLGINCRHSVECLSKKGYLAAMEAAMDENDLEKLLTSYYFAETDNNKKLKLCVIEAPWISLENLFKITRRYSDVHFVVRSHSNVGFLQVEPLAVSMIRELILHQEMERNVNISGNSDSFCNFFREVYDSNVVYLPNLYDMDRVTERKRCIYNSGSLIKVGSFGAIRLQKNHITGAAASLMLGRIANSPIEFHIVTAPQESPGASEVLKAIRALFVNVKWASFVENKWAPWPEFRRLAASMNLCYHLSATETFGLTTADSIAEGVPVIGSQALTWLPEDWKCNLDDPEEAASIGYRVLNDCRSSYRGINHLNQVCEKHIKIWSRFLSSIGIKPIKRTVNSDEE